MRKVQLNNAHQSDPNLTAITSELHVYRGHQKSGTDFIMGHEFTGHISEIGSEVKNFKVGDHVVSPFTTCCGECFYCTHGFSSRCEKVLLFGSGPLDGGQAEYVRIPLADSTAVKAPSGIKDEALVLMADIFPTGTFNFEGCRTPNLGHAQNPITCFI
jgi:threonine dehydrogenase-like Zn-dependent dehydrogenase